MANTSSAKKAARKMLRRTEINKSRRSRLKLQVRKVEEALASGDKAAAQSAFRLAEPLMMRTAQKGVVPRRAAARKVSRLAARLKAFAGKDVELEVKEDPELIGGVAVKIGDWVLDSSLRGQPQLSRR